MDIIVERLKSLTRDMLAHKNPSDETGVCLAAGVVLLRELSKCWKKYEGMTVPTPDEMKVRLDALTKAIIKLEPKQSTPEEIASYVGELKGLWGLYDAWDSFDKVEVELNEHTAERDAERRSAKCWDVSGSTLTTKITLTEKQHEAMALLDDAEHDKVLLLGGSGSGKSFIEAYKIIRDALRYKAPCLIARDAFTDLQKGMIDQIVPAILQLIAETNGEKDWKKWKIDGLQFAKMTEKKSKLEFATGGYVLFGSLGARDASDAGMDKILSPSWLHIMLEEVSELSYPTVQKILTRLRYNQKGVLNKLIMCENPPSINHWSYQRFFEFEKVDGTPLTDREKSQQVQLLMNPQDNLANLSEAYIENLSQFTGADYDRFYLGAFQDTEVGEILTPMRWSDNFPRSFDYEKIILYVDPTPLVTEEYSIWADYKASVLVGLFDGAVWVIDWRLVRGSTMSMLQSIKQLWDITPNRAITEVWMENKAIPSDFKTVWNQFQNLTNWYEPINKDKRKLGDKKEMIEMFLEPLFKNGNIFFNAKIKNLERGKTGAFQINKFSRKANKRIHDDFPDAIMRAYTMLTGKQRRKHMQSENEVLFRMIPPAFKHTGG